MAALSPFAGPAAARLRRAGSAQLLERITAPWAKDWRFGFAGLCFVFRARFVIYPKP